MPLYEYKCDKCGQVFEVIQRFSDDPLTTHEVCGGHVERLISAPSFQFKGSGFYITDYARNTPGGNAPATGANKNGASTESKESKPATSTSDSKPSSTSSTTESKK
jgi:putative FmdB family regulatory protein